MPQPLEIKTSSAATKAPDEPLVVAATLPNFWALNAVAFSIPPQILKEDEDRRLVQLYQYAPIANAEKQADGKEEKDSKMVDGKAITFNHQLEVLFQNLLKWGKDQGCASLEFSVNELRDRFKEYRTSGSSQQLSSAKCFLEQIYLHLTNNDVDLAKRKAFYERFKDESVYCGPGTYMNLENLSELINSKDSLSHWLHRLRKKIIDDIIALYILLHPTQSNIEQSTHLSIAIGRYAQQHQWGIEVPHDQYTHVYNCSALDYENFHQAFIEQFTPTKIMDELVIRVTQKITGLLSEFGIEKKLLWGPENAKARADYDKFTETLKDFFHEKLGFKIPIPQSTTYESPLTHFFDQEALLDPGQLKFKSDQVKPVILRTLYHLSQQNTGPFRKEAWRVIELKDGKRLYLFYSKPSQTESELFWLEQPEQAPQTWEQYNAVDPINKLKAILQVADEMQVKEIIKAFICCAQGKLIAQLAPILIEHLFKYWEEHKKTNSSLPNSQREEKIKSSTQSVLFFIPLHGLDRFIFLLIQQKCWPEAMQILQLDIDFDLNKHCCSETAYFALHYAVAAKQTALVNQLCARGANPLFISKQNSFIRQTAKTALELILDAADAKPVTDNAAITSILTNCTRKLTQQQRSEALAQTADHGEWLRVLKNIDAKQIDPHEISPISRRTALQTVVAHNDINNVEIITTLCKNRDGCLLKGGFANQTALEFAQANKNHEILSLLVLNSPIEILQQCDRDFLDEVLVILVEHKQTEAVWRVLDNVNPLPLLNKKDKNSNLFTPFFDFISSQADSDVKSRVIKKTAQILIDNPNLYHKNDYSRIFILLGSYNYWDEVKHFLKVIYKIDLTSWEISNNLIQHFAVKAQRFDVLNLLLSREVDLHQQQTRDPKKTAFELGCEINPNEMRKFVIENYKFARTLNSQQSKLLLQDLIIHSRWREITAFIQQISKIPIAADSSLDSAQYFIEAVAFMLAENNHWDELREVFNDSSVKFNYISASSGDGISHLAMRKLDLGILQFIIKKAPNSLFTRQQMHPFKSAFQLGCEISPRKMRMLIIENPRLAQHLCIEDKLLLELLLKDLITQSCWPELTSFIQKVNREVADEKSSIPEPTVSGLVALMLAENNHWDGLREVFKDSSVNFDYISESSGSCISHLAMKKQDFVVLQFIINKAPNSLFTQQKKDPFKSVFELGCEINPNGMRKFVIENYRFVQQFNSQQFKLLLQDLIIHRRWSEITTFIQQITAISIATDRFLCITQYAAETVALILAENDHWDGLREVFNDSGVKFYCIPESSQSYISHLAMKKQDSGALQFIIKKAPNSLFARQNREPFKSAFQLGCEINPNEMRMLIIENPVLAQLLCIQDELLLRLLLRDLITECCWSKLTSFIQKVNRKVADEKSLISKPAVAVSDIVALMLAENNHWDGLREVFKDSSVNFDYISESSRSCILYLAMKKQEFGVLQFIIKKSPNSLFMRQKNYAFKSAFQLGCEINPNQMRTLIIENPTLAQHICIQDELLLELLLHDLITKCYWSELTSFIQKVNIKVADEKSSIPEPTVSGLVALMLAKKGCWDGLFSTFKDAIPTNFDLCCLERGDYVSHLAVKAKKIDILKSLKLKHRVDLYKPQEKNPKKTAFQLGCETSPEQMRDWAIENPLIIEKLTTYPSRLESLLWDLIAEKRWLDIINFIQKIDARFTGKVDHFSNLLELAALLLAKNDRWDGVCSILTSFPDTAPNFNLWYLLESGDYLTHLAVKKQRFDVLKLLKLHKADLYKLQNKDHGKSAFQLGYEYAPNPMCQWVVKNLLLAQQLNPEQFELLFQDLMKNRGWPEIIRLVECMNMPSISDEKSSTNNFNLFGLLTLMLAKNHRWDGVDEIFRRGIFINFDSCHLRRVNECYLLHIAAENGNFAVLKHLVSLGANLHQPQNIPPYKTAFQLGCEKDPTQMGELVCNTPLLLNALTIDHLNILFRSCFQLQQFESLYYFYTIVVTQAGPVPSLPSDQKTTNINPIQASIKNNQEILKYIFSSAAANEQLELMLDEYESGKCPLLNEKFWEELLLMLVEKKYWNIVITILNTARIKIDFSLYNEQVDYIERCAACEMRSDVLEALNRKRASWQQQSMILEKTALEITRAPKPVETSANIAANPTIFQIPVTTSPKLDAKADSDHPTENSNNSGTNRLRP